MNDVPAPQRAPNDLVFHLTTLILCGGVIIASALLEVDGTRVVLPGTEIALPGICWFRRLLDMNCPGCGLTRSFISLAHGSWSAAWHFNAAGPLLFALVVSQIPYQSCQLWRLRRGLSPWRLGATATIPVVVFAGALFAQWLIRVCAHFFG